MGTYPKEINPVEMFLQVSLPLKLGKSSKEFLLQVLIYEQIYNGRGSPSFTTLEVTMTAYKQ